MPRLKLVNIAVRCRWVRETFCIYVGTWVHLFNLIVARIAVHLTCTRFSHGNAAWNSIPVHGQDAVAARDEAVRSSADMRAKLSDFEGTLRGVSEETLVVLEKKEAVVQRVQAERDHERKTWEDGKSIYIYIYIRSTRVL